MKKFYLNTGTINDIFNQLGTAFNGILDSKDNESKLTLDSGLIKGNIDGVTFLNGITSIQLDMTFSDDVMLSIESLSKSSVLFAYCTEGAVEHRFGISGHKSTLRKHHSGVVTSSRNINSILYFKKDMPIKLSLIKVETEGLVPVVNDPIVSKLKKTFFNKQPNYSYIGIQNLKITEKFNQLNLITATGMTGHIKKKDLIMSVLAMEIDDNTDTLVKISRKIQRLATNQIDGFRTITSHIKEYAFGSIYSKAKASKNSIMIK